MYQFWYNLNDTIVKRKQSKEAIDIHEWKCAILPVMMNKKKIPARAAQESGRIISVVAD